MKLRKPSEIKEDGFYKALWHRTTGPSIWIVVKKNAERWLVADGPRWYHADGKVTDHVLEIGDRVELPTNGEK